jgi:hypothetical protein
MPGGRPAHAREPGQTTRVPETFLPDERGERARLPVEDHLAPNPGQLSLVARSFSPAPLNAVGAGLPATSQASRARLCYVEREDPGEGTRNRAAQRPSRRGTSVCPQPGLQAPAGPEQPAPTSASRSKNPVRTPRRKSARQFPAPLDRLSLTLVWLPRISLPELISARSGQVRSRRRSASRAVLGAYLVLPPVWWALMIGSGSMLSMMARMSSGLSHSQSCSS